MGLKLNISNRCITGVLWRDYENNICALLEKYVNEVVRCWPGTISDSSMVPSGEEWFVWDLGGVLLLGMCCGGLI